MVKKWLVVGLGNPEGKYFQTYHNLGFLACDLIAERLNLTFKKKGNQLIATHTITRGVEVFFLKPLTYMNLSGQAVLALARKQNIAPENIIVLVDDLDLDMGTIRVRHGGSGGSHNGLRSINELLQTNQYTKVRMGIKPHKEWRGTMANYVLSKIDPEIRHLIDESIEKAVDTTLELINGN